MPLHLKDCSPALRLKIEAALAAQYPAPPEPQYAMATFLKGKWTLSPITTNKRLVLKLVQTFNLNSGPHAAQTLAGKPPAVIVEILK